MPNATRNREPTPLQQIIAQCHTYQTQHNPRATGLELEFLCERVVMALHCRLEACTPNGYLNLDMVRDVVAEFMGTNDPAPPGDLVSPEVASMWPTIDGELVQHEPDGLWGGWYGR